ncbi:MAG: hypothetical protein WC501_01900 [Candidatus Micrarchaeia archaeon]
MQQQITTRPNQASKRLIRLRNDIHDMGTENGRLVLRKIKENETRIRVSFTQMIPLLDEERTLGDEKLASQNIFLIACHMGEIGPYSQMAEILNLQRNYGDTKNTLIEMALYETAMGDHANLMINLIEKFNADVNTIVHNEPRMINPPKGEIGISNPLIGCIVDVGGLKALEVLLEYGADLSKKYCNRNFRRINIFELALERFFRQHREKRADKDSDEFKIVHAIEKHSIKTKILPPLFSVLVSTQYLMDETSSKCQARAVEQIWNNEKLPELKGKGEYMYLSDTLAEKYNMSKILSSGTLLNM